MDFLNFLIELDARSQAKIRIGDVPRDERIQNARMSDQALIKKRAEEITKQQASDDPLDRQIATLQKRLDQLMLKRQQQRKREGNER